LSRYIRNYEILRELGSGQFGQVFIGVGEVPGRGLSAGKRRMVAIKQLRRADPHHRELLEREFELLDEVKHRGIVRVFEFLKDENAVVMEHVHGVTLRQLLDECLRSREQVFTEAAIEMICELADALYQAWTTPSDNGEALQLVHRDLKPENIMVTPRGEVKILDFGLARVDNGEYAPEKNDRIKGTPVYMSPEQASGQLVDHRSDLFSLGLIAYELFMNKPAYTVSANSRDPLGEIFDAIERGALHQQVQELEAKLPGVGPIIARLLQANPNTRYQTGQDLLVDLRRQLYRDRGSYLGEFCEFFFGSIYDLPAAPDPDAPPGASGAGTSRSSLSGGASSSGSKKRMTIEERLRASMARDAQARQAAEKPSTWRDPQRAEPLNTQGHPAPRKGPPAPLRPTPRRAPPSAATTSEAGVGNRSPQDDGMLEFVDLDQGFGDALGADEGSATAFFAIPQLKEASRPSAPPSVAPSPVVAAPPHAGRPIMAPVGGPVAAGPVVIASPIAQGPVAEYKVGGPVSPQGPAGGAPVPPPANDSGRTESKRVAVIILGMFALLGVATFLAVWGSSMLGENDAGRGDPIVDVGNRQSTTGEIDPNSIAADVDKNGDTGSGEPPIKPPVKSPTKAGKGTNTSSQSGGGGSQAAPRVASGTLNLKVTGPPTKVELQCGGQRERRTISGGRASFNNVAGSGCKITFSGHGAKAVFNGVSGGRSLSCSIDGGTVNCS
jgi:serine/threonine protein kinase